MFVFIHHISPSCQLPLFFCFFLCLPFSPYLTHFSFPLPLTPPLHISPPPAPFLSFLYLSLRQNTNKHLSSSLLPLHLKFFLFLQKLIFPINFLCLNSLSSSLSMTHRLYPPLPSLPPSSSSSPHLFTLSGKFYLESIHGCPGFTSPSFLLCFFLFLSNSHPSFFFIPPPSLFLFSVQIRR